ncbi:MAG: SusF/SusE family outer membrane protein [Prevotella sp.]|nr:SusE domain-containing protein [Prevotella sp.]MCR5818788.1 SusF/SusE family outer membrane protein [Prevotella sp.]
MKKLSIIFPLLVGAFLMVACETDRDDNPTIDLSKKQEAITLNIPTFANSTYDLANTDSVTLTCTAPNYGFPATTTYVVQLSIDEDMSNPSELTTTYYLNRMVVPGREIAMATTKQMINKKGLKQEDFPVETAAYLRIRAFIEGTPETETLSNIVKLNKIKTKFALPDVTMPDSMFVIGTFTDNDWKKSVKTIQVNNSTQNHWRMVWMDSKGVRLSPIQGEPNFSDNMITPIHVCNTTGFSVSSDGVVTAEKPGWYVMLIEGTGNNEKRQLTLTYRFYEATVWLIGPSLTNALGDDIKDCWTEKGLRDNYTDYVKFTTPTTMDGVFVSPPLVGNVTGDDGGVRAYVSIKWDWWQTEFMAYPNDKDRTSSKRIIKYRGNGDEVKPFVDGIQGQRVYLNFSNDTGEIK